MAAAALRRHPRLDGVEPRWFLIDQRRASSARCRIASPRSAARTLTGAAIEILGRTGLTVGRPRRRALSDGRRIDTGPSSGPPGVSANPLSPTARAPARRPRPRPGRRALPRRRPATASTRWATRRRPERGHRQFDPPTSPARAAPGAPARRQPRARAAPYALPPAGSMATLGRRHGIAVLGRVRCAGSPAGSWPAATTWRRSRSPPAAPACSADWIAAAVFRRDVVAT